MGPGSWNLDFDGLPDSVRQQVQKLDQVAIGPRGIPVETMSDAAILAVLDAADGYLGLILAQEHAQDSWSGMDCSWWLGFGDAAPLTSSAISLSTSTTSNALDQILPVNGLSKGSVTNGSTITAIILPQTPIIHALNFIAESADVEWQIRPDNTIDVAPSTTLFPAPTATAATIITRDAGTDEGGLTGVQAASMSRLRDATNIASEVAVLYGVTQSKVQFATSTQTPTGVRWKDLGGAAPSERTAIADGPQLNATDADRYADRLIARLSAEHREATLSTSEGWTVDRLLPGARVWVYDLEAGFVTTTNQVVWRGQTINPSQLRVSSCTWAVDSSVGVYARLNGGATWLDLTNYVVPEAPSTTLVVSTTAWLVNRSPIKSGIVTIRTDSKDGKTASATVDRRTTITGGDTGAGADLSWTPSWTNLTVGTGGSPVNQGAYSVSAGRMRLQVYMKMGTTGSVTSSSVYLSMPTGWQLDQLVAGSYAYGLCWIDGGGSDKFVGIVRSDGTNLNRLYIRVQQANTLASYNVGTADITTTVPFTWSAGDILTIDLELPVEPT